MNPSSHESFSNSSWFTKKIKARRGNRKLAPFSSWFRDSYLLGTRTSLSGKTLPDRAKKAFFREGAKRTIDAIQQSGILRSTDSSSILMKEPNI